MKSQFSKSSPILDQFLERSDEGFLMIDKQGNIIKYNDRLLEMMGITEDDLRFTSIYDFYKIVFNKTSQNNKTLEIINNEISKALDGKKVGWLDNPIDIEIPTLNKNFRYFRVTSFLLHIEGSTYLASIIKDITDKKKIETQLGDSEEKLRERLKELNLMYKLSEIYDINAPSLTQFFKKLISIVPAGFKFPSICVCSIIYDGKVYQSEEYREVDRNLSIYFEILKKKCRITVAYLEEEQFLDEERKLLYAVGEKVKYIIGFHQTKRNLVLSEKRFRILINQAPDIILTVDEDYHIKFINSPPPGLTKETVLGTSVLLYVSPENEELVKDKIMSVFNSGNPTSYETTARGPYDAISAYSTTLSLIEYDNERHVLLITRDITEKYEHERRIRESEILYRELFEKASDAIFWADAETGIIINCNKKASKLLERPKHNLLGKHHSIIHPLEKANLNVEGFKKNTLGEEFEGVERFLYSKSGKRIPVLLSTSMVKIGGRKVIQGIFHDISEMKRIQEELEILNEIKSDFLRRASHELKTPLISVKGFTNLILELHEKELSENVRSYISEIETGCDRLVNIVNNLLKSSSLETNELTVNAKKSDLSFLIHFTIRELRSLAKKRKIKIQLEIPQVLNVSMEKEEIHVVLSNLIGNAIKYTPLGGKVIIKTQETEKNVRFSIKDSGVGFTEEEKERIFRKFGKIERYGQGFNLDIDGTGLGLYISKKIIMAHAGNIWMVSKGRNKGSTFYFTLPKMS